MLSAEYCMCSFYHIVVHMVLQNCRCHCLRSGQEGGREEHSCVRSWWWYFWCDAADHWQRRFRSLVHKWRYTSWWVLLNWVIWSVAEGQSVWLWIGIGRSERLCRLYNLGRLIDLLLMTWLCLFVHIQLMLLYIILWQHCSCRLIITVHV